MKKKGSNGTIPPSPQNEMKGAISQFLVCEDTLLGAPFYFPIEAEPKPVLER